MNIHKLVEGGGVGRTGAGHIKHGVVTKMGVVTLVEGRD